jgi:virulence factor Mce-like protein
MRKLKENNRQRRWTVLGVLAVVVVALIGWIAYNANLGLPWQSTYDVYADVPNADRLIKTADVRIGGVRVGQVNAVDAEPGSDGRGPYTRLELALSGVSHVPRNSTVQVRPASVLGLTYVDLHLGRSRAQLPANGTLALSQARPASDLTDLFEIFNTGSAHSFQNAISGFAAGLAGRGTDLNTTIHALSQAMVPTQDVARVLAATQTQFAAFLSAFEQTASALAPVSSELAGATSGAATTLQSLADTRRSLAAAIEDAPGAEQAATTAFTRAQPAVSGLAQLVVDLRPAGALLSGSVAEINTTLRAGLPPLRELPAFSQRLSAALTAVHRLSSDSNTVNSLRKLTDLSTAGQGALSDLAPAQIDCNVLSLFMIGFAGVFGTQGTGEGPSLGNLVLEETGAVGEPLQNAKPSINVGINPLPHETAQECESGNEPWSGKQQLGNPPGLQSTEVRQSVQPPGVPALAAKAGLMQDPKGL